jgi:putative SOS response-associated peptidase YedK
MPAILAPSEFEAWLEQGQEEARALLKQYPTELVVARLVESTRQ